VKVSIKMTFEFEKQRLLTYLMTTTMSNELLNVVFASAFTANAVSQAFQSLEVREKAWRMDDLPLVEEDWVRNHLSKMDTHKSIRPNGMQPRVLRDLADVIAEALSIIFERSLRTRIRGTRALEESHCHFSLQKG